MSTKLPTKPGPYYWREKDGDEWEHIFVMDPGNGHLYGHDGVVATSLHDWEQDRGAVGQWLPIPTVYLRTRYNNPKGKAMKPPEPLYPCHFCNEELVELQSAKKMVDEGFEDAYVVTSVSGRSVSIDFTEPRAWSLAERLEGIFRCDLESSGYTCRKVRVCKEVES